MRDLPELPSFSDHERAIGTRLYLLLIRPELWVKRRVETVRFEADGLVRRSVSVDFYIDQEDLGPDAGCPSGTFLVPIAMLAKTPLALLDVSDESGQTLPVLSTPENGRLAYFALAAAASDAAENLGISSLPDVLKPALFRIAMSPQAHASALLDAVKDLDNPDARQIATDFIVEKLSRDLARNFLLLAELGQPNAAPRRRIVKFSYVTPTEPQKARLRWLLDPAVRTLTFDLPSIGDAASYHFQLVPPAGVVVSDCSLSLRQPYEREPSVKQGEAVGGVGHVQTSEGTAGVIGSAEIRMSPNGHGLVSAAMISSGLNFALLACLFFLGETGLLRPSRGTGPDIWQSIVLAVPAAAAGFLANQGEPGLVSRLLGGARGALLASALTSFCVAFTFTLELAADPDQAARLRSAAVTLGASVSMICFTWLVHWWAVCRQAGARAGVD